MCYQQGSAPPFLSAALMRRPISVLNRPSASHILSTSTPDSRFWASMSACRGPELSGQDLKITGAQDRLVQASGGKEREVQRA